MFWWEEPRRKLKKGLVATSSTSVLIVGDDGSVSGTEAWIWLPATTWSVMDEGEGNKHLAEL